MYPLNKTGLPLLLLVGLVGTLPRPAAAQKTYVAIGDSLAYGFKSLTPTSPNFTLPGGPGFPGYVSAYDSSLSAQTGTAYNAINLGIVGELAVTLNSAVTSGETDASLNSNYGATDTQMSLLHATSLAQHAAGHDVGIITIQIGANDMLSLASQTSFQTAYFLGGLPAVQSQINATVAGVQSSMGALLTQIHQDTPTASVVVMGYYNPYAALNGNTPIDQFLHGAAPGLLSSLNAGLQQEAGLFGARYVDLAMPFSQHLADYDDYTLANSSQDDLMALGFTDLPNDHPTDLGYALIARTLAAPEPAAWTSLCLGALGLTGLMIHARRRKV